MEKGSKKHALSLGIRIGVVFLIAIIVIILVAYYVLSQTFHSLLTNYTVKLVQTMTNQGVEMVENELANGRKEAIILADKLNAPDHGVQDITFPEAFAEDNLLRMVYVSAYHTAASDGRLRDIRDRPDIQDAFRGEVTVYGPYFNEENEFVVCYTAPVRRSGDILGVLSVEKDGYLFCDLIKSIQFVNSGESYIINAEGTDIAVSRQEHIDWVTSQYNARKLLEKDRSAETISILELEEKGLRGETGVGTYYWEDGLVYVIYEPIPSVNWVLLAGLREEEIAAMTQSALFASISKGPTLAFCLILFFLLTGLIIYWIISSMKKNAEINEKLEIIANHDSLTGLLNRRFLETNLSELWAYPVKVPSSAAIFMLDIDNFKSYNDYYGHPKGDDCLRRIASVFKHAFDGYNCNIMRYGGEEFIAAVFLINRQLAQELGQKICRLVEDEQMPNSQKGVVTVSVGVCYVNSTLDFALFDCIKIADKALYDAKKSGKNRAVVFDAGD